VLNNANRVTGSPPGYIFFKNYKNGCETGNARMDNVHVPGSKLLITF
jgi:hypothetical protein